jgi:hypothetical protein
MKLSRCRLLPKRPLTGTWFRAIRPQFLHTVLAYAHTATIPGRFNPGSSARPAFPVLYFAQDQLVALFEVNALLGSPLPGQPFLPNPNQPWAVVNVDVQLSKVADLCQQSQRRLIETTVQEMTGDWRGYSLRNPNPALRPPYYTNVPTQRLSFALHAARGREGFLTYSARVPTARCLIAFPDKLRKGSFVRFTDPVTNRAYSIP